MKPLVRIALAVALVAAIGFAGYSIWNARQAPVADLPEGPREVLPASEFINAEASIAYYREKLRRAPNDVKSRIALAQALLQQAQTTGRESEYVPEARAALAEVLRQDPENYHALLLQATLLNTLHHFEEGRDLARGLIAEHPRHAYPYGVLVDGLVELGQYDEAVAASDTMISIKPSLAAYSRVSYLRQLHGDTEGAIAAMRLAADAGMHGHADRAWALYNLGNLYLGQARPDTAAYIFRGILTERPDFANAVAGLGHVALAKGDYEAAIRQFETAYGMAPRDSYLEGLAEAYRASGDEARADETAKKVREGFARDRSIGEIVDMEEADFMLDYGIEVERALEMARGQVERRPGHLHANETYAWALHKNGRSREAIPYIERAMRLGTGDAMVHYRAGVIYEAAGNRAEAARQVQLALANHLRVESPTAARDARDMLAALGGESEPVRQATISE